MQIRWHCREREVGDRTNLKIAAVFPCLLLSAVFAAVFALSPTSRDTNYEGYLCLSHRWEMGVTLPPYKQ